MEEPLAWQDVGFPPWSLFHRFLPVVLHVWKFGITLYSCLWRKSSHFIIIWFEIWTPRRKTAPKNDSCFKMLLFILQKLFDLLLYLFFNLSCFYIIHEKQSSSYIKQQTPAFTFSRELSPFILTHSIINLSSPDADCILHTKAQNHPFSTRVVPAGNNSGSVHHTASPTLPTALFLFKWERMSHRTACQNSVKCCLINSSSIFV